MAGDDQRSPGTNAGEPMRLESFGNEGDGRLTRSASGLKKKDRRPGCAQSEAVKACALAEDARVVVDKLIFITLVACLFAQQLMQRVTCLIRRVNDPAIFQPGNSGLVGPNPTRDFRVTETNFSEFFDDFLPHVAI
jgi:hypothetical protein